VGRGTGGGSSGRAEFAGACLALQESLTHEQPIAVLTDSMSIYWLVSSKFSVKGWILDSSPFSLKLELTQESFLTRRPTDGRARDETMSIM